ncbi:hypothetical protein BDC45DRAFT_539779 [Circinella umbellata]|nr:hypothetical protein BDC45DRAFT_539779 [Circinella umbellata]
MIEKSSFRTNISSIFQFPRKRVYSPQSSIKALSPSSSSTIKQNTNPFSPISSNLMRRYTSWCLTHISAKQGTSGTPCKVTYAIYLTRKKQNWVTPSFDQFLQYKSSVGRSMCRISNHDEIHPNLWVNYDDVIILCFCIIIHYVLGASKWTGDRFHFLKLSICANIAFN